MNEEAKVILKDTLKEFAPNSYEKLTEFIVNHPETDAITFKQLEKALAIYKKQKVEELKEVLTMPPLDRFKHYLERKIIEIFEVRNEMEKIK
ncbi:MAG: hypothetical protein KKD44_27520 [Proteobacteria bacterium]|nr:hypothetical protein [Pseudomonadota bacterium]